MVVELADDPVRRLLSPGHPDDGAGAGQHAGRIVPANTPVRIARLEFPTPDALVRRPLGPWRGLAWLHLSVKGEPADRDYIVPLPAELGTYDRLVGEVDRHFASEPLDVALDAYSDEVRDAIARKRLLGGMDQPAVEMSWGYPVRRSITFKEGVREEQWIYASGRRKVWFSGGKVVRFEPE